MKEELKVLVVDDFSTMRRIICGILKRLNISNVVEAEDGLEALRRLNEQRIDLILCDWNMPNMSGLELLKHVKLDEGLRYIPFIMVTAESNKENIVEAAKAGVNNYVVKPFTHDVLQKKIEDAFKSIGKKAPI